MSRPLKIMISAGEASGDRLGAGLALAGTAAIGLAAALARARGKKVDPSPKRVLA